MKLYVPFVKYAIELVVGCDSFCKMIEEIKGTTKEEADLDIASELNLIVAWVERLRARMVDVLWTWEFLAVNRKEVSRHNVDISYKFDMFFDEKFRKCLASVDSTLASEDGGTKSAFAPVENKCSLTVGEDSVENGKRDVLKIVDSVLCSVIFVNKDATAVVLSKADLWESICEDDIKIVTVGCDSTVEFCKLEGKRICKNEFLKFGVCVDNDKPTEEDRGILAGGDNGKWGLPLSVDEEKGLLTEKAVAALGYEIPSVGEKTVSVGEEGDNLLRKDVMPVAEKAKYVWERETMTIRKEFALVIKEDKPVEKEIESLEEKIVVSVDKGETKVWKRNKLLGKKTILGIGEKTIMVGEVSRSYGEETILLGEESRSYGEETILVSEETRLFGEETILVGEETRLLG